MIELKPLVSSDREQFIKDNQETFNYGALEEFGLRDDHFEESIDSGEAYRILDGGKVVGGVVVRIEGDRGNLDLLFVSPKCHSKGVGYGAWCQIEKMFPQVKIQETVTPYFEKRNIHFYVNRCGFKIVEFFNSHHKDPNDDEASEMFRFEKHLQFQILGGQYYD